MNSARDKKSESNTGSWWRKNWSNIVDSLAKIIGSAAIVAVALVAHSFESSLSATSLLNQREQAETNLRATLLHDLITTVTNPSGDKLIIGREDLEREEVLVKLLALNFHDHFEFKPLLLDVDKRLAEAGNDAGRKSLQSVGRRIVDRQITRLLAVGRSTGQFASYANVYFSPSDGSEESEEILENTKDLNCSQWTSPAEGGGDAGEDLEDPKDDEGDVSEDMGNNTEAAPESHTGDGGGATGDKDDSMDRDTERHNIKDYNPALFENNEVSVGAAQTVCFRSPDRKYVLGIGLHWFKRSTLRANVYATVMSADLTKSIWYRTFTVTPFDFPLTDNSRIDSSHRFALNLYDIIESGNGVETEGQTKIPSYQLQFEVVWFPKGYVTERERPVNYLELRKFLDVGEGS